MGFCSFNGILWQTHLEASLAKTPTSRSQFAFSYEYAIEVRAGRAKECEKRIKNKLDRKKVEIELRSFLGKTRWRQFYKSVKRWCDWMNATWYATVADTEHGSRRSRVSKSILEKTTAEKQLVRYLQGLQPSKRNMAAEWGNWENSASSSKHRQGK